MAAAIAAAVGCLDLPVPMAGVAVAAGNLPEIPRSHGPSTREEIVLPAAEPPGTIIVSTDLRTLDLVIGGGRAFRYRIAVGRDGFGWTGVMTIGRKAEWPSWRPPPEMRARDPGLPELVPPGPLNPLGARALYLFSNGKDSLYRIHGTNDVASIGGEFSSGCFRMTNRDVLELFDLVPVGSKVIVR